ncbi:MAG: hypothetical protein PHY09_11465 [Desulfuromonadaceae bacterium]|nr:hypothetical protein [Desulfuromonadaceae bacterium]
MRWSPAGTPEPHPFLPMASMNDSAPNYVPSTGGKATLADGSMVQTAHVVVDHVTVGPKAKRYLNVQIMPRSGNEETGLLGMNFLGDFPHIIEAKAGTIRWQ